jgi:hypothetical protein
MLTGWMRKEGRLVFGILILAKESLMSLKRVFMKLIYRTVMNTLFLWVESKEFNGCKLKIHPNPLFTRLLFYQIYRQIHPI